LKVAVKKPEVRRHIQFRDDVALVEFTAIGADLRDAVHHQHRRRRQLRIAWAEISAFARFEELLLRVGRLRRVKIVGVGQTNHQGGVYGIGIDPKLATRRIMR
jgi:hypothetical protein